MKTKWDNSYEAKLPKIDPAVSAKHKKDGIRFIYTLVLIASSCLILMVSCGTFSVQAAGITKVCDAAETAVDYNGNRRLINFIPQLFTVTDYGDHFTFSAQDNMITRPKLTRAKSGFRFYKDIDGKTYGSNGTEYMFGTEEESGSDTSTFLINCRRVR